MLINPGDLIPVRSEAIHIPWTKRKSTILNFLHRGPVTFKTFVYDTNVGDISSLATYFNPERWTNKDLNTKFGHKPRTNLAQAVAEGGIYQSSISPPPGDQDQEDAPSVLPRLLLYPFGDEDPSSAQTHPETPPQTPPPHQRVSPPTVTASKPSSTSSSSSSSPQQESSSEALRDQQTFEWVISQQDSSPNESTKPPQNNAVTPPQASATQPSQPTFDDVFITSSSAASSNQNHIWSSLLTPHDHRSNGESGGWSKKENLPEIQRPSDLWRFGSTSTCNEETSSSLGGFWAWNPSSSSSTKQFPSKNTRSDSTSSSSSSSDEANSNNNAGGGGGGRWNNGRLGSTGWTSTGPSSVHGSMESLTAFKTYDNEETNFLLGESLLQNLTNFKTRNETLV